MVGPFSSSHVCAVSIFLCLSVLSPGVATSSVIVPAGLDETAAAANMIFAGTVRRLEYDRIPDVGIVTRVTFGDLEFLTQAQQGTVIIMTVRGGKLGNLMAQVAGLPEFQRSKRYVVFADDLGSIRNSYTPIIGLSQGVFRVESLRGRRIVTDAHGNPLTAVEAGRVDVMDEDHLPAAGPSKQEAKKMRLELPPGSPTNTGAQASQAYWPDAVRDSILRSPQVVLDRTGRQVKRVFSRQSDPGTRVTEDEFLRIVRGLLIGR